MEPVVHTIMINRPIEEVFDVATCQERCVVWRGPITVAKKTSPGPVEVGATYEHTVKFLGISLVARPKVTVWDPPHRAEFINEAAPVTYHLSFNCEAKNGGTELTTRIEAQTRGAFTHIIDDLVHKALMRQQGGDLETLKMLMESESPITVPPNA